MAWITKDNFRRIKSTLPDGEVEMFAGIDEEKGWFMGNLIATRLREVYEHSSDEILKLNISEITDTVNAACDDTNIYDNEVRNAFSECVLYETFTQVSDIPLYIHFDRSTMDDMMITAMLDGMFHWSKDLFRKAGYIQHPLGMRS